MRALWLVKKTLILIVAYVVLFFLAVGGCVGCFFIGRAAGYSDGHSVGYDDGKKDGIEDGKNAGYDDGYNHGHSEGLMSGQRLCKNGGI